jgi:acetyl-CoA acyltransferase 1
VFWGVSPQERRSTFFGLRLGNQTIYPVGYPAMEELLTVAATVQHNGGSTHPVSGIAYIQRHPHGRQTVEVATMSKLPVLARSLSDIVIVSALRTPVTKARKGGLKDMYPEELLAQTLEGTVSRLNLDKSVVNDILVGTVLQNLGGQKSSALAVKCVGFPVSTTVNTINRQCSSSAQAMSYMAAALRSGDIDVGIAAGVESMTHDYFPHRGIPTRISEDLLSGASEEAKGVLMPMGITSENVVKKYGISRSSQDELALRSHVNAARATESGHFAKEIIPVNARFVGEDGSTSQIVVDKDDGIRANISIEKLEALKAVFSEDGTTTAGNSSQISDGASAVVLTTREKAQQLGLKPLARFIASKVAGVPSTLMGIGPAAAVPEVLKRTGLNVSDVDIFELNEAFASQSVYCVEQLGLDIDKVNPNGGAIAIGHPLGATGGRIVATLLNGLRASDGEIGVMSMCMSTGQGYAAVLARE